MVGGYVGWGSSKIMGESSVRTWGEIAELCAVGRESIYTEFYSMETVHAGLSAYLS